MANHKKPKLERKKTRSLGMADDMYRPLRQKARECDVGISEVIRRLVARWLDGDQEFNEAVVGDRSAKIAR